jgi:HAD superfamily hydrolase (TIGR01509 family)
MPIECVLFDHDDTLIPTFSLRTRAFAQAMRELMHEDVDAVELFRVHAGETIECTARRLTAGDEPLATQLVQVYRDIYYSSTAGMLGTFPGTASTLEILRGRGVRVAVVTSKVRWGAELELERAGIRASIELIVGSEDVAHPKPAPDPLECAMKAFGLPPGTCLMVGDTAADLLAARSAGVLSAAALWGTQDRAALLALAPTYALESIVDVVAVAENT